jgi:hypothetical protein
MPLGVGRTLSDVAEIINKLWGSDTRGGRLFPGLVARVPRAIALAPDGLSSVVFPSLLSIREDDPKYRDWAYAVYLASLDEDLVAIRAGGPKSTYQPGFQTTTYPCDLLWGPGQRDELRSRLDRFDDDALCDEVEYLDRVFVIRLAGEKPDAARSPADFEALRDAEGAWYVVRADHPLDAWSHVRDHRGKPVSELKGGHCPDCPVRELGRFGSHAETKSYLQAR